MNESEIAKHIWRVCNGWESDSDEANRGLSYYVGDIQEKAIDGSLHITRKQMKKDIKIIDSIISDLKDLKAYIKEHIDDVESPVVEAARERGMIELPKSGTLISLPEFIEDCKQGFFVDGSGFYATLSLYDPSKPCLPSDVLAGRVLHEYPYILWPDR
jgi:hypothetical protein